MIPRDWRNALLLGVLSACAYIGLTCGHDIARYRAMVAALAAIEECQTEDECIYAYERLEDAKR